ncbi:MAG TPA: hypothetical protein VFL74_02835 [Sphingomicrobium sp.]|nr:hypothetical protein [Sphingomicrobium sp.]
MSSAPAAADIAKDATWLVQALDARNGVARLVRMDVDSYREASFLDDRMMQQPREAHVVPWGAIRGALAIEARRDARWIFHIGHVGSTLVARLLGEVEGVLSIREPRFLRDVAMLGSADRADYTAPARALFSRTFGEDEIALVKATSFVSEIADELVPEGQRALFMYATPRNYVASILAGPNSVQELAALAPSRVQRMSGRVTLPQPRNTAEAAAAAWACEMTALESAAERMADREIAWADFDAMLADMPAELKQVAEFFGFPTDGIDAIASGPLMRRYSKATEYEYSPSLRRDLIAEAEAANRADLDGALAMLQSAAETSPLLAKALRRAECTESSRS